MKAIFNELIDHRSLTKEAAKNVLVELASGKYNPSQMAAFMTVYMMRSITVDELQGFRDAMLELCVPVHFEQPVIKPYLRGHGVGHFHPVQCSLHTDARSIRAAFAFRDISAT